jgi:hypothetical protein
MRKHYGAAVNPASGFADGILANRRARDAVLDTSITELLAATSLQDIKAVKPPEVMPGKQNQHLKCCVSFVT